MRGCANAVSAERAMKDEVNSRGGIARLYALTAERGGQSAERRRQIRSRFCALRSAHCPLNMVSPVGIEPTTNWLKASCSTTELRARRRDGQHTDRWRVCQPLRQTSYSPERDALDEQRSVAATAASRARWRRPVVIFWYYHAYDHGQTG